MLPWMQFTHTHARMRLSYSVNGFINSLSREVVSPLCIRVKYTHTQTHSKLLMSIKNELYMGGSGRLLLLL